MKEVIGSFLIRQDFILYNYGLKNFLVGSTPELIKTIYEIESNIYLKLTQGIHSIETYFYFKYNHNSSRSIGTNIKSRKH